MTAATTGDVGGGRGVDSTPNFRQVGTRTGGHVLRGAAVRRQPPPDPQSRVSSIPSKYETVLHPEPNERNAFGNRTQRFNANESDLPGPGAYYKPPSLVRTTTDSGSVSKLGYSTGFVSKTKRFGDRVRDVVPGPGQYQSTTASTLERRSLNKKHGSSAFASSERSSNNNPLTAAGATGPVPGPGDYNISQQSSAIAHNIARAAFSSRTSRGFEPKLDVPPPGQYDNPIQLGHGLRGSHSPQSVFKSTAKRLDSPREAKRVPGPGAYNAEDAEVALHYDWIARAHTSAVFHRGNVDRFGHGPSKRSSDSELGPGSYNVEPTMTPAEETKWRHGRKFQVSAHSSVFRSSTARGGDFGGGGPQARGGESHPGPAFYHPSSPERRSHILNSNKKWL